MRYTITTLLANFAAQQHLGSVRERDVT